MRKTLSVRPEEDDAAQPASPPRKGKVWAVAESRLDTLHETARERRRNPTPAQTALADALTRAQLGKHRFRQNVVIGSVIVDFASQPLRVVVQIDDEAKGDPAIDRRRDKALEAIGQLVLRYPAADVLADADAVAATIFAQMKIRWQTQRARPRSSTGANARRTQTDRRGY